MKLQRKIITPPLVSPEHCKEKITCIRAHRERIFQIYDQLNYGKLLIHNYGHGGAGWTFLFGAVNEALRIFERHALQKQKIAVIGAGCYGLLTAIMLARKGFEVTVIARDIDEIPSTKAAGFFFPRHRKCSNAEEIAVFKRLGQESYAAYLQIAQGIHPFLQCGAKLLPAYYGLDIDPGFSSYHEQGLIDSPTRVLVDFNNGKAYEMFEYKTIFIDTHNLLQELWSIVKKLGIQLIRNEVQNFEELQENVVFNCAGMGAKKLVNDKRIIPVQGHLITLQNQPPLEQLQYMINVKVTMTDLQGRPRDELIYYAPKKEGIVGITFLRGQDSLTTNQHEFDRLIERCQKFFGTTDF